jgi:hypothetical protein
MNNSMNRQIGNRGTQRSPGGALHSREAYVLLEDFDKAEKQRIMSAIDSLDKLRDLIDSDELNRGIGDVIDAATEYASSYGTERAKKWLKNIGSGNPFDVLLKTTQGLRDAIGDVRDAVFMSVRTKNLASVVKKVAADNPNVAEMSLMEFVDAAGGNSANLPSALNRAFKVKKFLFRAGIVKNADSVVTDILGMPMSKIAKLIKLQFPQNTDPIEVDDATTGGGGGDKRKGGSGGGGGGGKGEGEAGNKSGGTTGGGAAGGGAKRKRKLPDEISSKLEDLLSDFDEGDAAEQRALALSVWKNSLKFALKKAGGAQNKDGKFGDFIFTESRDPSQMTLRERYIAKKAQQLLEAEGDAAPPQGKKFDEAIKTYIEDMADDLLDAEIAEDFSNMVLDSLKNMTLQDLEKQAKAAGVGSRRSSRRSSTGDATGGTPASAAEKSDAAPASSAAGKDGGKKPEGPAKQGDEQTGTSTEKDANKKTDELSKAAAPAPEPAQGEPRKESHFEKFKDRLTPELSKKLDELMDKAEDKEGTKKKIVNSLQFAISKYLKARDGGKNDITEARSLRKRYLLLREANYKFDDHIRDDIMNFLNKQGTRDLYDSLKSFLIKKGGEDMKGLESLSKELSTTDGAKDPVSSAGPSKEPAQETGKEKKQPMGVDAAKAEILKDPEERKRLEKQGVVFKDSPQEPTAKSRDDNAGPQLPKAQGSSKEEKPKKPARTYDVGSVSPADEFKDRPDLQAQLGSKKKQERAPSDAERREPSLGGDRQDKDKAEKTPKSPPRGGDLRNIDLSGEKEKQPEKKKSTGGSLADERPAYTSDDRGFFGNLFSRKKKN